MTDTEINSQMQNETLEPSVRGKDPRLLRQIPAKAPRSKYPRSKSPRKGKDPQLLKQVTGKAPRKSKKTTMKKQYLDLKITDEQLEDIPFCDSPFFTNEFVAKFFPQEKTARGYGFSQKFEKFLENVQLLNRASFQKELFNAKSVEKRRDIVDKFMSVCGEGAPLSKTAMGYISKLITDTGDENDILIFKKNGRVKGIAIVSKSDENNSYELQLLCSKNVEKGGSFLLTAYLLALKAKDLNKGSLMVANSYSNLEALCLYDKFGFREDPTLIKKYKDLFMSCDLTDVKNDRIYNTFLGDDIKVKKPWLLKKTEPLCSEEFRSLDAVIQEDIINFRDDSLRDIKTDKDVDEIREATKKRIKEEIENNKKWDSLRNEE